MIGYVTIGSDNMPRARAFYDELLGSTIGAKRMMEFGDDLGGFTMWGTGFDKPGIAVTNPYNKQPASPGNGNMTAIAIDRRAKVDALPVAPEGEVAIEHTEEFLLTIMNVRRRPLAGGQRSAFS